MDKTILIVAIVLVSILAILTIALIFINKKKMSIKATILGSECINHKEFEKNWSGSGGGKRAFNTGYKYMSCCGCYVITIFSKKPDESDHTKYEKVYVGSGNNVFLKIHNHFTGKGNPDIASACKKGKYVYASIIPCDKDNLEKTEKQLSAIFAETKFRNPFKK